MSPIAALLLFAALPQEGDIMGPLPGVEELPGARHFCGAHVAIDIAVDERIARQRGPDFDLYFLRSAHGGFGIYEGDYPEEGGASEPATVAGLPAARRHEENGGFSYLVRVPGNSHPGFVHLYGSVWKGDARDAPLLARIRIGEPAAIGCPRPTFPG